MKKIRMIGCEEALKQLYQYLDQDLSKVKDREMHHHLSRCRSCYSRADFEKKIKDRLQEVGRASAGDSLEKRIKKILGGM
jgi:mycothiol system anti-sigma-R factor